MKNYLFTIIGWYCWVIHSLVVLGVLAAALLVAMQWSGITVTINLPTIEHVFKNR